MARHASDDFPHPSRRCNDSACYRRTATRVAHAMLHFVKRGARAVGLSHRGTQHVDSHFMARFTAFRQPIRHRDFSCKKFLSTKIGNGLWIDM